MNIYEVETSQKTYHVQANDIKHAYDLTSQCLINNTNLVVKSITLVCTLLDTNEE